MGQNMTISEWEISERLIKCNMAPVFVNELNFSLHILKAHNQSNKMHIKHMKNLLINEKNDVIFC